MIDLSNMRVADPMADLVEFLELQPTLLRMVDDIHQHWLPPSYVKRSSKTRAPTVILLQGRGGVIKPDLSPWNRGSVDVYVYSASPDKARKVDQLVYYLLDNLNGFNSIDHVEMGGEVYSAVEPKLGWQGLFRNYVVQYLDKGKPIV